MRKSPIGLTLATAMLPGCASIISGSLRIRKVVLSVAVAVAVAGCTEAVDAKRVLEDSGYTHVVTGGYPWGGAYCGSPSATSFTATSPGGRVVSGAVCNRLPGYTIVLD